MLIRTIENKQQAHHLSRFAGLGGAADQRNGPQYVTLHALSRGEALSTVHRSRALPIPGGQKQSCVAGWGQH